MEEMNEPMTISERARLAAERLRRQVAEHANGPDCGDTYCILHDRRAAVTAARTHPHHTNQTEETR